MSGEIFDIDKKAMELKANIYASRINELAKVYGSVRAVGRALNIDHAYLWRLSRGEKVNASKVVLRKLGLG